MIHPQLLQCFNKVMFSVLFFIFTKKTEINLIHCKMDFKDMD